MITIGSRVKVIGIVDRDDKQVYGKVLQISPDWAIVDIGEKVLGLLPKELILAE